jgi:hypothetical protein
MLAESSGDFWQRLSLELLDGFACLTDRSGSRPTVRIQPAPPFSPAIFRSFGRIDRKPRVCAGTSYHDVGGSTSAYTAPTRNSTGDISGLAQISTGTTFAKLPGTVVTGMRVYCSNCDPPANPPVICTSAGARTGAFADGVNNTWLCLP